MDTIMADLRLISRTKTSAGEEQLLLKCIITRTQKANAGRRGLAGFHCHGNVFCHVSLGTIAVILILIVSNLSYVQSSQSMNTVLSGCIIKWVKETTS